MFIIQSGRSEGQNVKINLQGASVFDIFKRFVEKKYYWIYEKFTRVILTFYDDIT